MTADDDKAPVVIFETQDENEAGIVQKLLETHGIYGYRTSDITRSLYPITIDGLGLVKVLVAGEHQADALRILREFLESQSLAEGEEIT
jgi:hypothetical protein